MGADCKSVGESLHRFESCTCHALKALYSYELIPSSLDGWNGFEGIAMALFICCDRVAVRRACGSLSRRMFG